MQFSIVTVVAVLSILLSRGRTEPPSNFQQYGPPQQNFGQQQQQQRQSYGPPGHTPGTPLGLDNNGLGQSYGGPDNGANCPPNDPEANRRLVLKAYQEVFGDLNTANIDQYFGSGYIQHNPMAGDGLPALKGFVEMVKMVDKPQKIGIMRSAADGNLVWTHSRVNFFGTTFAAADIFRIECGKIIEHWDVLQDTKLMMEARNSHPFF